MNFRVRFADEALADPERPYDFALQRDDGDWTVAERALDAIRSGIAVLESSPFRCRKALARDSFMCESVIGIGAHGYIAHFEIEDANTLTALAVRHQREEACR